MKKIFKALFLSLLVLGQTAALAQSLSVKQSGYAQSEYAFKAPHYTVSGVQAGGNTFSCITIGGAAPSTQLGRPNLPVITEAIEIPLCGNVKVSVSNVREKVVESLKYPVIPVQPAPGKSDKTPQPFVIDSALYATDTLIGQPAAWVDVLGVARDRNIALLRVSPFSYNPVSGALQIIESMDITITFENADMAATEQMHRRYYSPDFSLGNHLLSSLPVGKDVRQGAPLHYLIVAHSSFRGQLDQFITWKKRQGFLVTVGYTDDAAVGSTNTSIANYTKSFYDNASESLPAPTYLLLVGDNQQIPAFGSRVTSPSSDHVTDLYFATWTTGDNIPDCYLGRFSAQTVAQLTPQIEKSILYENYNFSDPSYLGKGILISGVDGGYSGDNAYRYADPAMDYVAKYYVNASNGFTDVKYYKNNTSFAPAGVTVTGSSNTTATANTLKNLYNQGYGWINYSAHGNDDCWGTPSFTTSDAAAMTNNGKPSIMIGNCCLTGRFNTSSGDCFGESLLHKGNNAGAVTYIGGTNSTYWPHDFTWQVGVRSSISNEMDATYDAANLGMYDRLFHTHGEGYGAWHTTTGAMVNAGNMAVESYGSYQQYYWEIYELFGDPSLMPWLTPASDLTAAYSSVIVVGDASFTVSAVPYAYVALTTPEGHDLVAAAYADATGSATLSIPTAITPGELELAIWAQNFKPLFDTVNVIVPDGPYVMVTDIVPVSGKLRPDEIATFNITITNVGTALPTQGLIEFASDNPKVAVIQPQSRFTACAPGDTVTLAGVNAAYLSDELSDGESVRFDVSVDFGGSTPAVKSKTFAVSCSSLVASVATATPALASGTASTITCTVTNVGSDTTTDLTFSLVSNFGFLTVQAEDQTSTPLAPGESVTLAFDVTMGANAPDATVPFYLYATNDHGTALVRELNLNSGVCLVEDFESGSLTQNSWVQNSNPWEITSGEVNSGNYSARSKSGLGNGASSQMSISWTSAIDDTVSFSYKVSSEANWDKFTFSIDGINKLTVSGEEAWARVSYPVSAGTHTFMFDYTKDGSMSNGSDCAWIDDVRMPFNGTRCSFTIDTVCQGADYTFAGQSVNTDNVGVFAYVDSTSSVRQYLSLVVLGQPEVEISTEGVGDCMLLKASGAVTYEWSTGETGSYIVVCPTETTNISVTGYRGGCSGTAHTSLLGIEDVSMQPEVKLYPNPAKGSVTVATPGMRGVELISLMGQTIQRKQVNADHISLDLRDLPAGVYFVKVKTANSSTIKKLICK